MKTNRNLAEASDPSTSESRLRELAFVWPTDKEVQRAVARNMAASASVLSSLFESFPEEVLTNPASELFALEAINEGRGPLGWIALPRRRKVAKSTRSAVVMERMSHDEDWNVRETIAGRAKLAAPVLERLAQDTSMSVRAKVAKNASTPAHVLASLENDPEWYVRAAIAESMRTPVEVLERLADDPDHNVRWRIAMHARVSKETLRRMAARDPDKNVRSGAQGSLESGGGTGP